MQHWRQETRNCKLWTRACQTVQMKTPNRKTWTGNYQLQSVHWKFQTPHCKQKAGNQQLNQQKATKSSLLEKLHPKLQMAIPKQNGKKGNCELHTKTSELDIKITNCKLKTADSAPKPTPRYLGFKTHPTTAFTVWGDVLRRRDGLNFGDGDLRLGFGGGDVRSSRQFGIDLFISTTWRWIALCRTAHLMIVWTLEYPVAEFALHRAPHDAVHCMIIV